MAIRGVLAANETEGRHVVTTAIEHPGVLETCKYLETKGVEVTYVPVGRSGVVDPEDVGKAHSGRYGYRQRDARE